MEQRNDSRAFVVGGILLQNTLNYFIVGCSKIEGNIRVVVIRVTMLRNVKETLMTRIQCSVGRRAKQSECVEAAEMNDKGARSYS